MSNNFEEAIREKEEVDFKKPSLYNVIFLNDDVTTFDFVVLVLQKYFSRSLDDAIDLSFKIDDEGFAIVGTYTKEVAEMKVLEVINFARSEGFPLMLIMEKNE